ncbi:Rhomboid- protein 2 [Bulinus truncatus]|nr:Rhomboid- protein 2 [Bulinus truncatus]
MEYEEESRPLDQVIDEDFKPIFKDYGEDGIPLGQLHNELNERALLGHIPTNRRNELITNADRDADKRITYREFDRMVKHDMSSKERGGISRQIMRTALATLMPTREREDFLANYNCCPPPIFIPLISVIEIVVFIVYVFELKERGIKTTFTSGFDSESPLVYKSCKRFEAWRFLTYMLIHQGYSHIIFNLGFQLLFGSLLEVVHKHWRVAIVYLLGVIAGCLAHSVIEPKISLVGASGGVYAILGAFVASVVINWREMNYRWLDLGEMDNNLLCAACRFLSSAPVRLAIILLLVVSDTSLAIYRRVNEPNQNKVGVSAHIGGFLAGLALGIVFLKNVNTLRWEKILGWVSLAVFLVFVVFCVLFNVFYDGYKPTEW